MAFSYAVASEPSSASAAPVKSSSLAPRDTRSVHVWSRSRSWVKCCDDVDVRLRHGRELPPEPFERLAVESPRARLELGRVDEVGRADLGDMDLQAGMLADEHTGGAGVVEMDVREQQVADVAERQAA